MGGFELSFIVGFLGIWFAQLYWLSLVIGALLALGKYRDDQLRLDKTPLTDPPKVTILIPAYNEGVVIRDTLNAMAELNYPADRLQVILVNDGSSDDTGDIGAELAAQHDIIEVFNVPKGMGGKGKSRTLNNGMSRATGEVIVVFDADNTPEPDCLIYLIKTLRDDPTLVAVNGKVRTRNWNSSLMTRFIAVEFIFSQWIFQAGRWQMLRLSTLMGTNYAIWRDALEMLGGFDEESLVDDTEMSLRIFLGTKRIKWIPYAVTWEQEPDELGQFIKQRTRWTQGNFYVIRKFFSQSLRKPYPIGLEILNSVLNYIVFLPALVLSHMVFVTGISGIYQIAIPGPFFILWSFAVALYFVQVSLTLAIESAPAKLYFVGFLAYFTYMQLFVIIVLRAAWMSGKNLLRGQTAAWDKTARKKE